MKVTQEWIRAMRKKMAATVATTDNSSVLDTLSKLAEVSNHILSANGLPGWSATIPWIQEIPDIEATLKPFADFLLRLRDGKEQDLVSQSGGDGDYSLDGLFESAQNGMKIISGFTEQIASQFGTAELFRSEDMKPFQGIQGVFPPFTTPLGPFPTGIGLSELPVSKSFLLYIGYMALDLLRLTVTLTMPGMVRTRQLMSLVLGIMDVLGGNWKNALVSLAGIFSSSAVVPGFVVKMAISLLGTMPDTLQTDLTWMVYRATKAMVVGFLVQLYLLMAPKESRLNVMDYIQKIADQKVNINQRLADAGLPRTQIESRRFGAAAAVGTVSDDIKVCSAEFKLLIPLILESSILTLAAQLAGLPTSEEEITRMCQALYDIAVKNQYRSYGHVLAAQGLSALLKKEVEDEAGLLAEASRAAAAAASGCDGSAAATATPP